ncbi:MAG: peptide-methionine (S)-S-oxide reductase MsrA [Actinomycetota bacterium]|nr:peptide-methionine (S)-S-oxide reductase MsrA [Actinomycetota bacterium]MCL6093416.1 peptide-methionine (S)-S-oxide reductase MsrA [Actinomycetota bacterium]MDA8166529.1 peptide-methionine (S)-S-oxide reductase MsrA [Actinomycetota bacterium]
MAPAKAMFGAGCFWGVEEAFRAVPGVINTTVGYAGGMIENPGYEEVCSGETGHAETVLVEYDPDRISYEDLLAKFWEIHDPTTRDRQGPDIGSQYRSIIFYFTPEQEQAAQKSMQELEESGKYRVGNYRRPVVTEILAAGPFYPAEEYHQRYLEKRQSRLSWR